MMKRELTKTKLRKSSNKNNTTNKKGNIGNISNLDIDNSLSHSLIVDNPLKNNKDFDDIVIINKNYHASNTIMEFNNIDIQRLSQDNLLNDFIEESDIKISKPVKVRNWFSNSNKSKIKILR